LQEIKIPVLVVHSREDKSVPFAHAEWSLQNIPQARLCETGFTGHFIWADPDHAKINAQMADFLQNTN
jgi:pimeloyl-ACP methyl ester carboxylesterase